MRKPAKLEAVLEALELQMNEFSYFLDLRTGKVIAVLREHLRAAEEGESFDHLYEWQWEAIQTAIDIEVNFEHYAALPGKSDINEYQTMEDFCFTIQSDKDRTRLPDAIQGKGAFRRFQSAISSS